MNYKIEITFTTDRPLTSEEQFLLVGACRVQVEEPADAEGDDMTVETTDVNSRISMA